MKSFLLIIGMACCCLKVSSQSYQTENGDPERLSDELFPIQNTDLDYAQLYESLALYLSNPIDLNKATAEQLRALFILSEMQITSFIRYRKDQGELLSKYELQSIPHYDLSTIKKLLPFVVVHSPTLSFRSLIRRLLHEKNNYFIFRISRTLEEKQGYLQNASKSIPYEGSPYQVYTRFRVARAGDYSLGFTLEKDAGESFKWDPSQGTFGFDYASIHAQILNKGKIKNIIVGDYQAQFGQGVILGGGFGMGKGAEPIMTVRRSNLGFLPYTSLNESGFFRGGALSIAPIDRITLHGFFSYTPKDGNTFSDSIGTSLSSLTSSGLHRTQSEIKNKKSYDEMNYGFIVTYKTKQLEIGSIMHTTLLNVPVYKTPTAYNQFAFRGNKNTNLGLFLNYTWNNFTFFSEAALSLGQGIAYVAGLACSLSNRFDLALLHRRFDPNFYSFYSNAFSENNSPQNESGYYIGWKYTVHKRIILSGYVDLFEFPWLRYRSYAPSSGREWLIRFSVKPNKQFSFYIQGRGESKIRNLSSPQNVFSTGQSIKRNYWIHFDYAVRPKWRFRSRIQYSSYMLEGKETYGIALIQDVRYAIGKFSCSMRYAFFDTEDYENRQYAYEQDVWLAYSFPAYSSVGIRSYVLLRYTLNKKIACWIRWSQTQYLYGDTIGSGGETIKGKSKNDLTLQLRIRL